MPGKLRRTVYGELGRHPVHPFPARMAPEIISATIARSRRKLRVLDPMSGSGTVLALARSHQHHAIGFDLDPLAVLIAQVWTQPVDQAAVELTANRVLKAAKDRAKSLPAASAYPYQATDATREFVRYWFELPARKQLAALAQSIKAVRNTSVRNVLWCAFSRMIISKQAGVSLALDLAHSRPHRSRDRAACRPFDVFGREVQFVLKNCLAKGGANLGPRSTVSEGDARAMPIADSSIDLVVTSPPYLNAIDYIRCSKFSLVWMGYSIEKLAYVRRLSVGSETGTDPAGDVQIRAILKSLKLEKLPRRKMGIVATYIQDMRSALAEVHRVLVPGGKAVYVVGENTISGKYIENGKILSLLAQSLGFRIAGYSRRKLPPNRRYLPPPTTTGGETLDSRMRAEIILEFRKRAASSNRKPS